MLRIFFLLKQHFCQWLCWWLWCHSQMDESGSVHWHRLECQEWVKEVPILTTSGLPVSKSRIQLHIAVLRGSLRMMRVILNALLWSTEFSHVISKCNTANARLRRWHPHLILLTTKNTRVEVGLCRFWSSAQAQASHDDRRKWNRVVVLQAGYPGFHRHAFNACLIAQKRYKVEQAKLESIH